MFYVDWTSMCQFVQVVVKHLKKQRYVWYWSSKAMQRAEIGQIQAVKTIFWVRVVNTRKLSHHWVVGLSCMNTQNITEQNTFDIDFITLLQNACRKVTVTV